MPSKSCLRPRLGFTLLAPNLGTASSASFLSLGELPAWVAIRTGVERIGKQGPVEQMGERVMARNTRELDLAGWKPGSGRLETP